LSKIFDPKTGVGRIRHFENTVQKYLKGWKKQGCLKKIKYKRINN